MRQLIVMYHQYSGIPKEELQFQWGEDLFSILGEQKTADLVVTKSVQDGSLNYFDPWNGRQSGLKERSHKRFQAWAP